MDVLRCLHSVICEEKNFLSLSLSLPHHMWMVWCTFACVLCSRHLAHLFSEWHMTTHLFNLVAPEWPIYLCLASACAFSTRQRRRRRRRRSNLSLFTVFQWTVSRFLPPLSLAARIYATRLARVQVKVKVSEQATRVNSFRRWQLTKVKMHLSDTRSRGDKN